MTTQVLIARHGNTFLPDEPPRRIGGQTDLPLVESAKSEEIGMYLKHYFMPNHIYCSPLKRTRQTCEIAINISRCDQALLYYDERFLEIDYGPDENKPENEVIERLGAKTIDNWNQHAQVPPGWKVDVEGIKSSWAAFFDEVLQQHRHQRILVVTSNGIARFAPAAAGIQHLPSLKMNTGHVSLLSHHHEWTCDFWNKAP